MELRPVEGGRADADDADAVAHLLVRQVLLEQVAGDDGDVVVVGERLAQLRQQLRRRLHPRPVVLVEDEEPWFPLACPGPSRRRTVTCRAVRRAPLSILLASPAYWPARAFGGPVVVARELVRRLVERGHRVDVVTTTLVDMHRRPAARGRTETVDGATVHYLPTPFSYRWMGITPTLPLALRRLGRPDVVHVFGFRDPVTTGTALWCRARRIPYVFEPLGMFRPRLRKVRLKRAFDATRRAWRRVGRGRRGRRPPRGSGRTSSRRRPGRARRRARQRLPRAAAASVENRLPRAGRPASQATRRSCSRVGRIAAGKGIEHLVARRATARGCARRPRRARRPPRRDRPRARCPGRSRPPRAACTRCRRATARRGTSTVPPSVVLRVRRRELRAGRGRGGRRRDAGRRDRPLRHRGAGSARARRSSCRTRASGDGGGRARARGRRRCAGAAGEGGVAAARRCSWDRVADVQEEIYRARCGARPP